MVVTRSGYDSNQESGGQVVRSGWIGCCKGFAAWIRDFVAVTFLFGVKDSRFSLWNVSLVLSRALLYALWLLLVTGLVQALRHEPENQTALARIIDTLVGTAPSQGEQDFHKLPERDAERERRSLNFDLHQLDAARLISRLAAPAPAAPGTSPTTPGATPGSSPSTPGTSPTTPGSPPFRIFSWVTLASGITGGIISLLSAVAGLYGFALWLHCARAIRNAENEVRRRRTLQPGGGEELAV